MTTRQFAYDYLEVFGERAAKGLSRRTRLSSPGALGEALDALEEAGDIAEVILVPGTTDPVCAARAAEVVAGR